MTISKGSSGAAIHFLPMLLLLATTVLFGWPPSVGRCSPTGAGTFLRDVETDAGTLRPGGEVRLSYRLEADAQVSISVYSPDLTVVRHLVRDQARPTGVNTVAWDGRDDNGEMVPDEAYFFGITAVNGLGGKAVYNPTSFSGGEIVTCSLDRLAPDASGGYTVNYTVPVPARVNILAGIHEGPLLKTILAWKPQAAGSHSIQWDGFDETGRLRVLDREMSHVLVNCFKLPDNSVVMQGSGDDYPAYQQKVQQQTAGATDDKISFRTVQESAVSRTGSNISPQYLAPRNEYAAPKFTVYKSRRSVASVTDGAGAASPSGLAESESTTVSGEIGLTIEVAPEDLATFNNSRFEIIVYVDDARYDEEEQAYSPYTYVLDTRKLANGRHVVTINQAGMAGQVGSYSFLLDVRN